MALPFIKTNFLFFPHFLPVFAYEYTFLHVISLNILYPALNLYVNYTKAFSVLLYICHYFSGKVDPECALSVIYYYLH